MKQESQLRRVVKFTSAEAAAQASIDLKREDYKRIVYSEVYSPMRPDTDNMFMTAEDIENMAHNFLAEGLTNSVDLQHNNILQDGCNVVESFIARAGDPTFIEGSWVVGIRILNDDVWAKVLSGEINGFSVEALVHFEESNLRVLNTETVTGHSSINEYHSHRFNATFDEFGNLTGGETDWVDGHKHLITNSTVTRFATGIVANRHRHTFASVDNLVLEAP